MEWPLALLVLGTSNEMPGDLNNCYAACFKSRVKVSFSRLMASDTIVYSGYIALMER